MGRNTAAKVRVVERMAKKISAEPRWPAANGSSPASISVDVLQDHDGIVHHQARGQHDGQQGKDVDGETAREHEEERAEQGDGQGDDGNERGPPIPEEDEDDQHDQGEAR